MSEPTKYERELQEKIHRAADLILEYGQIDGAHHKMWVIDQVLRILMGDTYKANIEGYETGEDGEEYTWDTGVAP